MPDQIGTLKTLMDMANDMDPNRKVMTNSEAIQAMGAMNTYGTLKKRLLEIQDLKNKGVNTGPLIGGWNPIGESRDKGPGPISQILSAVMPEKAGKRADLYNSINNTLSYAFGEGGRNLSENEKNLAGAMIPTPYMDDDVFNRQIDNSISNQIPLKLQEKAKLLLDMGMDEENVKKIMQRAME